MNTVDVYDRFMQKRYGVSKKDLKEWYDEYLDDVKIGAVEWASKSCLKIVNGFLNDIKLRRKFRICKDYKKVNDHCFEGIIKDSNEVIRVERDRTIKKIDRHINIYIYIDEHKAFECYNQKQAVEWIKKHLELKDAI